MKENKKRILFWFIVMIVFLILFLTGKSAYKNGYGKYGAIKNILQPIAIEFNTSDDVKRLTDIRAEVSKDKLVVTYINVNNKKEKYKFEYVNNNGIEYITNKDEYGSQTWNFIALQMANAVYRINGGKGSIFSLYETKQFATTTIEDGLIIDETSKTISINIRANVVKNVSGKIISIKDNVYAKDEDLVTLANDLKTNGFFIYQNQDVKIYVKNSNTIYEIYASLNDDNANRVYKSIANIIKVLKPNVYQTIDTTSEYIQFESSNNNYQTLTNVSFNEGNLFDGEDNIFELNLFK